MTYPGNRLFFIVPLIITVFLTRCADRPPERPSEEEILKAMHDDLSVSHEVADFMIKDNDGIELLAERLSKDPVAAAQLLEALARKGGGEKAIALACLRVVQWEQRNDPPAAGPDTAGPGSTTGERR